VCFLDLGGDVVFRDRDVEDHGVGSSADKIREDGQTTSCCHYTVAAFEGG
jgi:hypothetical protein